MLETLQRLRIRYPRWIVAWGIYFSDAVFSAMAFIWILAPIFTNGTQYSFLDLFFYLCSNANGFRFDLSASQFI